jgi:hypothetical protein
MTACAILVIFVVTTTISMMVTATKIVVMSIWRVRRVGHGLGFSFSLSARFLAGPRPSGGT